MAYQKRRYIKHNDNEIVNMISDYGYVLSESESEFTGLVNLIYVLTIPEVS